MGYDVHETIFESREEREADGRAVDPKWMQDTNMVAGMGGLTNGYSDLADGEDRAQLMNPQNIIGNLQDAKMIGASSKLNAIGAQQQKLALTGQG